MKQLLNGRQPSAEESIRLFVYGTLRRGGVSHHYLEAYPLLRTGLRLPGFEIYDAGWFPFAVRAGASSSIVGDLLEVPLSLMPVLDEYEGSAYVRHFRNKDKVLLYLKKDEEVRGYPLVPDGDWLPYYQQKQG